MNPIEQELWARFSAGMDALLAASGELQFHKLKMKMPDSEQYRMLKTLTPEGRRGYEPFLEREIFQQYANDPVRARQALHALLALLQVGLRNQSAGSRRAMRNDRVSGVLGALMLPVTVVGVLAVPHEVWRASTAGRRHHADRRPGSRPEYAAAFNKFMEILGDSRLPPELRDEVLERLEMHRTVEGTIASREKKLMKRVGSQAMADAGYRVHDQLPPQPAPQHYGDTPLVMVKQPADTEYGVGVLRPVAQRYPAAMRAPQDAADARDAAGSQAAAEAQAVEAQAAATRAAAAPLLPTGEDWEGIEDLAAVEQLIRTRAQARQETLRNTSAQG